MEILRLAGVGNIGGLQRCLLICLADVVELYEPSRFITPEAFDGLELPESAMKLKTNAELVMIYFVPGEGQFESPLAPGGGIFTHSVSFEAPGDWPEISAKLSRMRRKKWLAVMEDTNGLVRLAGGIKQGLRLNFGYSSQKRRYNISLEAAVAHDAYYLKGFDLASFTGSTSGFSEGFSFGFES